MRHYELMFVADPRLPDEDLVDLTEEYKKLITSAGGEIEKEESLGKRRLAYEIEKLKEGKYQVLYVKADGANPFPEVQQRMSQNDKVLRYLTVRTDREVEAVAAAATPAAGEES